MSHYDITCPSVYQNNQSGQFTIYVGSGTTTDPANEPESVGWVTIVKADHAGVPADSV